LIPGSDAAPGCASVQEWVFAQNSSWVVHLSWVLNNQSIAQGGIFVFLEESRNFLLTFSAALFQFVKLIVGFHFELAVWTWLIICFLPTSTP
jgi:hypothetical protein